MDVPTFALRLTALLLAVAILFAGLARTRAARRIGAPVAAERPSRSPLLLVPLAGALVVVLLSPAEPLPWLVVLGAVAFHFYSPHREDRVLGSHGIQRGWYSQRFEDVAAWRLTGDHLRVLLRGEWEAVPAPARDHAELRKVLEQRAPGRESRFTS